MGFSNFDPLGGSWFPVSRHTTRARRHRRKGSARDVAGGSRISTEVNVNRSRRSFLKSTGLGFLAFGLPPSFLVRAAGAEQNARGKSLVIVFQRGGMDGLNVVIPFKDQAYYALRPTIAVKEPA